MSKEIFYDDDARHRLLEGAKALYNAVKTTMGPKGRNVVISKSYGAPTITHDGVTVAKAFDIPDDKEEIYGYKAGAELIKQAASKMNDVAGDGTTTVTILTYHLLDQANKLIAAGHNPMILRRDLEAAGLVVLDNLKNESKPISDNKEKIAQIATISAGDEKIGELIAQIMSQIGKDGVVTVEEGQSLQLEKEVVEGFTFDRGFISPYMVTDTARMEAVYNKPAILITDKKISSAKEIVPLIEKVVASGLKNMVLIAEDVEGEALATLVLNRLKGVFNAVAVKAPAFGDNRTAILQDLAILTGATVVSSDQGHSLETAGLDVIGSARKVIVGKDETTIIEGEGDVQAIKERIAQVQSQAKIATSEFDADTYVKRAASLNGKVAVIKVGGATETEIEEKKFRVDDAVAAVKAALNEGIVPGGGVTLLNIRPKEAQTLEEDAKSTISAGAQILYKALEQPFRILLENANLSVEVYLNKIYQSNTKKGYGVDVNQSKELNQPEQHLVDMEKVGIIDPALVTREAIQNAISIAGTAMTMGALIVDLPKDNDLGASAGGGGMPGMGM